MSAVAAAGWAGDGVPARVVDHDRPCAGIAILTVRPWARLRYRPGQAVPVQTPRHPGQWRWYSPANAPRPDGTVELHVRAVAAGTVSGSLVDEVRPGELLHLGPPRDTGLHLRDGDLLLVAGGTGLAPLRALVEQVAAAPDGRRVTLIVGARAFIELYDAVTLDKLQCAHDWLTIVPAFSQDPHADPAEQGDALTIALDHLRPDQPVYVCGPPPDAGRLATAATRRRCARRPNPPAGPDWLKHGRPMRRRGGCLSRRIVGSVSRIRTGSGRSGRVPRRRGRPAS